MIDFNKFSILSQYGKKAGTMHHIDYLREIVSNYDKYLNSLISKKKEMSKKTVDRDTELYL